MEPTNGKPMSHEEWVESVQQEAATDAKSCRCPVRPWATPGSFASGSVSEARAVEAWQARHGSHPYAKARDELAKSLQYAEIRLGSASAVPNMVADVFGLPRESVGPHNAREAVQSVHERIRQRAEGE